MIKNTQTQSSSRINKKLTENELQKKFDQLYNENKKWKAKKDKMRQQRDLTRSLEDLKECTFKPTVNPELTYDGSNPGSFLKRQNDWLNKKEKKIEQMSRQTQKKQKKQCSFHPSISRKTYSILHNPKRIQFYHTDSAQNKSYIKGSSNSYKEMHIKKQGLKQLQKTNSVYEFSLLTQKRVHERQQSGNLSNLKEESSFKCVNSRRSYKKNNFQPMRVGNGIEEVEIQNIVIKGEQEDTFNSISSLQLRTERKEVQKQTIKIFEGEEQEEIEGSKKGDFVTDKQEALQVNDQERINIDEQKYEEQIRKDVDDDGESKKEDNEESKNEENEECI